VLHKKEEKKEEKHGELGHQHTLVAGAPLLAGPALAKPEAACPAISSWWRKEVQLGLSQVRLFVLFVKAPNLHVGHTASSQRVSKACRASTQCMAALPSSVPADKSDFLQLSRSLT
jgi:hypothetical protein